MQFEAVSNEKQDSVLFIKKEYEMKIFDKIILLASLPEMIKLVGSLADRLLKLLGIEIGDEL